MKTVILLVVSNIFMTFASFAGFSRALRLDPFEQPARSVGFQESGPCTFWRMADNSRMIRNDRTFDLAGAVPLVE